MTTELERQLLDLKPGDHICLIYETVAEQLAAAVPFLKEGLARGERRCLYVAGDPSVEVIAQALAAAGVDVAHEREQGTLWMPTKEESYLKGGKFNPQAMIDFLGQAQAQALADGFTGVQLVGEMTWALRPEVGCDRLIEFEALFNDSLANSRSIFLCLYNRSRFDPAVIHDVLRTHPIAIIGDLVCPNPYYEPPELVLSPEPQASAKYKRKRVAWWIAQLKRARVAEQERERAQEAVQESHRLLRVVLDTLPVGVAVTDQAGDIVLANAAAKRIWGDVIVSGGERRARSKGCWHDSGKMIEPESWASARALFEGRTSLNELIDIETFDGQQKTIQNSAAPIRNAEGLILGAVVVNEDVTERVRAEEALRESAARLHHLSRRLLEVQEEERRHLARELHDEIGQLLTGLRLLLKTDGDLSSEAAKTRFEQARSIVDGLLEKVRGMSFDLRPAALDQLGLLPALLTLFERYTAQTGVLVNLKHQGVEGRFAPEVETTAYRIVQEALTNVARHAGVADATVRVWANADILGLQIQDRGFGFDPEVALATPRSGGLAGMQERVQLLGGQLTIESRPGAGTQITVELPLHR